MEDLEAFRPKRWVRTDCNGWMSDHLTVVKASEKAVLLTLSSGRAAWIPKSWIKSMRSTTTYVVYELHHWVRSRANETQKLIFQFTV